MPTSASSWQCLKLVGSTSDLLLDQTNSKEVLADDGGPRTKTWRDEVPGLDLLWFRSGGRWQSYFIILMEYYSCCVIVKVSFNIGIFSCIEIFWLRIYRIMQK